MLSGLPLFVWRARACDSGNGSRTSQAGVSSVIGASAAIDVDCTTARERTATGQATESPKLQGAHHFDRRLVRREMKVGCRLGGCLAAGNFCQCRWHERLLSGGLKKRKTTMNALLIQLKRFLARPCPLFQSMSVPPFVLQRVKAN